MFTLTAMYCFMFFYIRIQSRKLANASTTGTSTSKYEPPHQLQSWNVNVEAGDPAQGAISSQPFTTKSDIVTVEDSPPQASQTKSNRPRGDKRINQVSLRLLCYPIMYLICTIPLEVARLSQFAGKRWGLPSVYLGACVFMTSGFFNVLLYTTTRKGIVSWGGCFRQCKYEFPRRTARSHLSSARRPSQASPGVIRTPWSVASKPSVTSLKPLANGPAKSHDEYDSLSSMEVPKQDHTTSDLRFTNESQW
jgi:hypothetical protein